MIRWVSGGIGRVFLVCCWHVCLDPEFSSSLLVSREGANLHCPPACTTLPVSGIASRDSPLLGLSRYVLHLRGGRSKRGGKRVKVALAIARKYGSNSTAGARFPTRFGPAITKWSSPDQNKVLLSPFMPGKVNGSTGPQFFHNASYKNLSKVYAPFQTMGRFPVPYVKKKKPLSNRQIANEARNRYRQVVPLPCHDAGLLAPRR